MDCGQVVFAGSELRKMAGVDGTGETRRGQLRGLLPKGDDRFDQASVFDREGGTEFAADTHDRGCF